MRTAFVAGLAALALSLQSASAAVPVVPTGAVAAAPAKAALVNLHAAKTLLEKADHDYDGHRAKAVQQINHAIEELHPHHANAATTGKTTTVLERYYLHQSLADQENIAQTAPQKRPRNRSKRA